MTKPKKVTDAWLRNLKYRPLESKGLKVDGAISKRTGKPIESRPGQLLPNRYPDERGMYVNVAPTGRVTFRYSYRWPKTAQGRRQLVTYGDYPILSLEKARDQHIDFQRKLRDGINPLEKRRIERQQITAPADFRSVAVRWYEKNKPAKSDSWKEANARYLEWAYPYIGTRDVRQLTARDISAVITPIENSGRKVAAEKARQCYAMVLDYAADKPEFLLKPGENAARALSVDLPNTKHHAHLQIADVAPFGRNRQT